MPLTGIGVWLPLDSHEHRWFWRPSQAFSQDQPSASWHHRTSPASHEGCDEFFFKNHVKRCEGNSNFWIKLFFGAVCLISWISWFFVACDCCFCPFLLVCALFGWRKRRQHPALSKTYLGRWKKSVAHLCLWQTHRDGRWLTLQSKTMQVPCNITQQSCNKTSKN